jgi:hypothetical protein
VNLPRTREALGKYTDARAQDLSNAQAAQRKTRVDTRLARMNEEVPTDPGVAPAGSTGVVVSFWMHAVRIAWNAPSRSGAEYVQSFGVRLTNQATLVEQTRALPTGQKAAWLDVVAHQASVRFVDRARWVSSWVTIHDHRRSQGYERSTSGE